MFRFGHRGSDFHHPVFALLVLILLAALVVIAVVYLVRSWRGSPGRAALPPPSGPSGPPGPIDPALTELRVRYARGDITWEEYAQRAGNLGYPYSPAPGPPPGGQTPPPIP